MMIKNETTMKTKGRNRNIRMKESEYESNMTNSFLTGACAGAGVAFVINWVSSIITKNKKKTGDTEHRSSVECLCR